MEVRAIYRNARMSPKKMRDVTRVIQGMSASAAIDILTYTAKKSARLILHTLNSAVANAEHNHELDVDELWIRSAVINPGRTLKRIKPRARGSADRIRKRSAHIHIILTDEELDTKIDRKQQRFYLWLNERNKKKPAGKAKQTKKSVKSTEAVEAKSTQDVKSKAKSKAKITPTKVAKSGTTTAKALQSDASKFRNDEKLGHIFEEKPDKVDDLKLISGVAEGLEKKLNNFGIYRFAQIAEWKKANVEEFDQLLQFHGRIERDDWIKQARELHHKKYEETK